MKYLKSRLTFFIYLITIIAILSTFPTANCFKNFGMNKPHHLFHLGDRRPVSLNIGWGYFADNQALRFKYANTNDQLYANMIIHDGQTIFQQNITDKKSQINTSIKYQLHSQTTPSWETQITMQNPQAKQVTWFTYISVENNDYRLVDHKKYTSYIYVSPQYVNDQLRNQIKLNSLSYLYPNQSISISQKITDMETGESKSDEQQISLFGVAANISQTYTMQQISQTFRHLVRVYNGKQTIQGDQKIDQLHIKQQDKQKFKNIIGKKDPKLVQWQKKQIQFMKQNNWTNKNYVVLFTYGTLRKGQKTTIYLTNQTSKTQKQFNNALFTKKSAQLHQKYTKNIKQQDRDKQQFVTHVISNLYGGLTFYFGRLYTQNSLTVHKQDYSYSFTPSRLIFPRSFLWDDGFHQSVIVHYNQQIVIDVLTNWMNKIDIFGWIGRQQIRGGQISSMMPDSRFVFQDWFQMNPPTLMMSLLTLIKKSQAQTQTQNNKQLTQQLQLFFINYYRKLQNWYRYFKNTQSHQSLDYSQNIKITDRFFRWHCKDECSKGNFMGSGLDDYPRRQQQTQIAKQHVDLLSWLYFFSDSLAQVGQYMEKLTNNRNKQQQKVLNVNKTSEKTTTTTNNNNNNKYTRRVNYYKRQSQKYINQLYQNFYDKSDKLFKDIVVTDAQLFLQKFVNKTGYINLFPFFTGMLQQQKYTHLSQQYKQNRIQSIRRCLQIMSNQKLLLSQDGLRSLSFSDELYGTDDNYWRGAVWLPINYMVLRACKIYYWNDTKLSKQIQVFYAQLRQRLITSIYSTYKDTGYLYQNYYQGRGHRGFPFYGWTSTIVNIITQQY